MVADAINKIKSSMEDLQEKRVPAEPIVRYLTGRLEGDEKFAALIMQEHKTVEKCFDFVYAQASCVCQSKNRPIFYCMTIQKPTTVFLLYRQNRPSRIMSGRFFI